MGSGVRFVYEIVTERSSQVDTMIDPMQPWPNEEMDTPERLETNPANEAQDNSFSDADYPSPFGSPEPEPYHYSEPPLISTTEEKDNKQRNAAIAVAAILLLCCCCGLIGFMYQWGGDMLLEYFALTP
jgi:hypothetical protein